MNADARHWQILALSGLFSISFVSSDFGARPKHLLAALLGAMIAQVAGTLLMNARRAKDSRKAGVPVTASRFAELATQAFQTSDTGHGFYFIAFADAEQVSGQGLGLSTGSKAGRPSRLKRPR